MRGERQRRTVPVENLTVYPTVEVARVARWAAREAGLNEAYGEAAHKVLIRVAHHGGYHAYQGRWYRNPRSAGAVVRGRGEWGEWNKIEVKVPAGVMSLVMCRIAKPGAWNGKAKIHSAGLKGGPPDIVLEDWRQSLVAIVAHEGTHAWQDARRLQRVNAGRRARYSEVECEWAEYRILQRWKEER